MQISCFLNVTPAVNWSQRDCLFLQVKTGFMLNIIGILCINLGINTWGYVMFDMGTFPEWANTTLDKPWVREDRERDGEREWPRIGF